MFLPVTRLSCLSSSDVFVVVNVLFLAFWIAKDLWLWRELRHGGTTTDVVSGSSLAFGPKTV